MNTRKGIARWTAWALLGLLAACGQATTTASGDSPGGGIGGTGVAARGTVRGFGSVIVNGIEFQVGDDTVIEKDGAAAAERDLRVGMVVLVTGTYEPDAPLTSLGFVPGVAERIEYVKEVEGPVAGDPSAGPFAVLNRPVSLSPGAVVESGPEGEELSDGALVEVSGLVETDGTVRATYVRVKGRFDLAREVQVTGLVSDFSVEDGTFRVDGRLVVFDAAATDFPAGIPENGDRAEVRGVLEQGGETVQASVVRILKGFPAGRRVEVEGVVGFVDVANAQFTLEHLVVDARSATFEGGGIEDLRSGDRVEVQGVIDENRVLVAKKVERED